MVKNKVVPAHQPTHERNRMQPHYTLCDKPIDTVMLALPHYVGNDITPAVPTCGICKKGGK